MRRILGSALAALAVTTAAGVLAVGPAGATNIGEEGCTPGFWKNHTSQWEEHRPTTLLQRQFDIPDELAEFREVTFLQALKLQGGRGVDGAAEILFRAAVAAFLNAAHEGVGYPYRRYNEPFSIQAKVNAALASGDRETMLDLAKVLDTANNLGCPL